MLDARFSFMILLAACLVLFPAPAICASSTASNILQGVVGAARFEEKSLTFRLDPPESGKEEDLSTMPWVGLIGQHLLPGGRTRVGFEGALLFGWRSRETKVFLGSNQAVVRIDSSLWLADLSAGILLDQRLGSRWRIYLAAGPAMLFGEHDEDEQVKSSGENGTEETENFDGGSESEFGVGGYARAGFEYELAPRAFVGFSVRGLATNLKFDNTVDSSEVNGLQAFVTFTRDFGP